MKKFLLTCFLALPCLFQKARIKIKAIIKRLEFLSPPTAPRCNVLIKYLAAGVFHPAKRSVFRAAYFQSNATWIGTYALILSLLCSSISPTLSKSAQSPPEPSLHRSAVPVSPHSGDTHRGEETLSDTFQGSSKSFSLASIPKSESESFRHEANAESTSDIRHRTSDIKLNFGLINPDQDMGAGEGTSCLQPAPFPVLSNQIKQELARQAPESQSLVSNVLLLESSNGFSETDTIPKTIESILFLELPSAYAADTLWLTYWDHYLGDSPELTPGTTIPLVAFQGDFFQGNMGFSVYKWTSTPSLNSSRVFKIRNGKSMLVNTWTIFPGDQARIRFDLLTGNAQFIGPSAEFFRAQYLLSGLEAGRKIEIHPLMVTRNPDRMLSDSSTQARFTLARSLSPALFPPMEFLTPGENASGLLDSLLTQDLKSSSVIRTLPELTAQLTTLQKEIILQQAWGELLTDHISRLSLLKNLLKQPENLRRYEEWKAGIPEPCPFETIEPAYLRAFYDLALLEAQIYDQALFTVLDGIPTNLRDLILGRYLMSTWRTKKGDQFAGLQKGLTLIETPWIAEKIQLLQESILPGSEFLPTPLIDTSGNAYDLNQLKGKSLLISFWISGCKFCINYYQITLKPIFEKFGGRKDLAFISVNADKNESYWKDHLASGNYAHPEMINLHLDGGTGLLKEYSISSFPQKLLVDSDFRLFLLTKNQYSPDELSNLILRLTEENRTDSVSKPK